MDRHSGDHPALAGMVGDDRLMDEPSRNPKASDSRPIRLLVIAVALVVVVRGANQVAGGPQDSWAAWAVRHPMTMLDILIAPPPQNPSAGWLWTHRDTVAVMLTDPPPHGS
jgi:hypothetical protein